MEKMRTRAGCGYPEHWSKLPSIPMVCKARCSHKERGLSTGIHMGGKGVWPWHRTSLCQRVSCDMQGYGGLVGHTHVRVPGNTPLLPDTERKRVGMFVSSVTHTSNDSKDDVPPQFWGSSLSHRRALYSTKQSDDPAKCAWRSEGILGLDCHYLEHSHLSCGCKRHEECCVLLIRVGFRSD